jgi:hypothetical protein
MTELQYMILMHLFFSLLRLLLSSRFNLLRDECFLMIDTKESEDEYACLCGLIVLITISGIYFVGFFYTGLDVAIAMFFSFIFNNLNLTSLQYG